MAGIDANQNSININAISDLKQSGPYLFDKDSNVKASVDLPLTVEAVLKTSTEVAFLPDSSHLI
jgi:hypothetical protein